MEYGEGPVMLRRSSSVVIGFFKKGAREFGFSTIVPAATMETYVWLPAIKTRDFSGSAIKREILSSRDEKSRFASPKDRKAVDLWGHVSVKVSIGGVHEDGSLELTEAIQEAAIIAKVISLKEAKKINTLQAYLSWYPHTQLTESFIQDEEMESMRSVSVGDLSVNAGKEARIGLFNQKYTVYNNKYESDLVEHGIPDSIFTFSHGLDFSKIIKVCFLLMQPVVQGNAIVMTNTLPKATYYGKAMLKEHRIALSFSSDDSQTFDRLMNEVDPYQQALDVCTTASLCLFKAGLGRAQYYKMVKQIFLDNPELARGVPLTDFVNIFNKTLHQDYALTLASKEKLEKYPAATTNIIFLDIDGVIYCGSIDDREHQKRMRTGEINNVKSYQSIIELIPDSMLNTLDKYDLSAVLGFSKKAINNLKKLCETYNAKIVISSSWRESKSLEQIKALFSISNFSEYIIDCTPQLSYPYNRGSEIESWLLKHSHQIRSFVILDDCKFDIPERFGERFVLCNRLFSDDLLYQKASNILGQPCKYESSESKLCPDAIVGIQP
ncbi:MAG: Ankyrin repeat (3 copies) [Gammaproteobacteria bacterium]|nr:Ankyrin repeat (3 copies) [Gammaproteobacteria bacterium]